MKTTQCAVQISPSCLEQWLYSNSESQKDQSEHQRLTLVKKLNLALDVSCAVDYLHNQCEKPIIHCDLKPSNILPADDMVARVGDFGLANIMHPEIADVTQSSSVGLKGTIGYAAPEYVLGSEISTNGDVYSFGILLLEMITGKRPTDALFKEGLNLHKFVGITLLDHVKDVVSLSMFYDDSQNRIVTTKNSGSDSDSDASLSENLTRECLVSALKVGIACSAESPQARMSITDVVVKLKSILDIINSLEMQSGDAKSCGI